MRQIILEGAAVYTEQGIVQEATVVIKDKLIQAIYPKSYKWQEEATKHYHFPPSYHIVPGFIDLHVHGSSGSDVMDGTADALITISRALAKEGTTAFLATTMTAEQAELETALKAVADFPKMTGAAALLGIHLEGPFLSPNKSGAQPVNKIISPNIELIKRWQAIAKHKIKLVTLAPEEPDSLEVIHYLTQHAIIASMGHSNANYQEAIAAIDAGCSHATHLFNAMRGMHHREPGIITAALLADQVMAELIVDGLHVHPAMVKLALKMKGVEKIILITDAMRAKCMADGCYELGGQKVNVQGGCATLDDGTLAGSVLPMISAVKNMLNFTGCSLEAAITMAAVNPAKALRIYANKGSLKAGKDADVVVLDENYNIVYTFCEGESAG